MKRALVLTASICLSYCLSGQKLIPKSTVDSSMILKLNKLEYFSSNALKVIVSQNDYAIGKQSGIEIIQHGERIASMGNIRINATMQNWTNFPKTLTREVDFKNNEITVISSYPDLQAEIKITVKAEGEIIRIKAEPVKPLSAEFKKSLGFEMSFLPSAYRDKSYSMDNAFGLIPHQSNGPVYNDSDGNVHPLPIVKGKELILAPEDSLHRIEINCIKGELNLSDGGAIVQDLWLYVRSLFSSSDNSVIEWVIKPAQLSNWKRQPAILYSQAGYHPMQGKKAIIESDPNDKQFDNAVLQHLETPGKYNDVLVSPLTIWGDYFCYRYTYFDFSTVKEEGIYRIKYKNQVTLPFKIDSDVYLKDVWQPSLEVFMPVQMCHMEIRDKYRVWHGVCHMDDALQAPYSPAHLDGYIQDRETETQFKPLEHIAGLNAGGWHDAGDYDLPAGSIANTTLNLALAFDEFHILTDQTTVNHKDHKVILHQPDGIPDMIQQIIHGVTNLLAGHKIAGHSFLGIIEGSTIQYVHLGDASTATDNRVYNSALNADEVKGNESGINDDRWAFTNKDSRLEYSVATALAASARVLKGFSDSIADECLNTAKRIWKYEQSHERVIHKNEYVPGNYDTEAIKAAVELYLTTKDAIYLESITEHRKAVQEVFGSVAWSLCRIIPYIQDSSFQNDFHKKIIEFAGKEKQAINSNPFGIKIYDGIWGFGSQGQGLYYLIKTYPGLFGKEYLYNTLHYILGCHPCNNMSLVSGIGINSSTISYAANRADWSYIPGGVCTGPALIKPDFPEFKPDFPFLWQQKEIVIGTTSNYIFLVNAAIKLLKEEKNDNLTGIYY